MCAQVMVSLEAESIQTSFSAPLPLLPVCAAHETARQPPAAPAAPADLPTHQPAAETSNQMLSSVFNSLFSGLQVQVGLIARIRCKLHSR